MSEHNLEEFLSIVRRDLGAAEVHVLDAAEEPPADDRSLRCDVPGGRRLIASFAAPVGDAEARRRRLEMLVSAFVDLLDEGRARTPRPPPARSLQEELAALAQRTGAVEVLIIDAFSPVVWGSVTTIDDHAARFAEVARDLRGALHEVRPEEVLAAAQYGLASAQGLRVDPVAMRLVPQVVCAQHRLVPVARAGDTLVVAMADPRDADAIRDLILLTGLTIEPVFAGESMAMFLRHLSDEGEARTSFEEVMAAIPAEVRAARAARAEEERERWARAVLARRAIAAVRALPDLDALNRGGQLRATVAADDFGYVARSFSAIYVAILVFGAPFDELTAKRALSHAMSTIERLVAALPPLDPPPHLGGVVAMRAPRRRRPGR